MKAKVFSTTTQNETRRTGIRPPSPWHFSISCKSCESSFFFQLFLFAFFHLQSAISVKRKQFLWGKNSGRRSSGTICITRSSGAICITRYSSACSMRLFFISIFVVLRVSRNPEDTEGYRTRLAPMIDGLLQTGTDGPTNSIIKLGLSSSHSIQLIFRDKDSNAGFIATDSGGRSTRCYTFDARYLIQICQIHVCVNRRPQF